MRKAIMCLLAVSLLTGGIAGAAPRARKDQASYTGPSVVHTKATDIKSDCAGDVGCTSFKVRKGERFLNVRVSDDAGEVVFAQVISDGDFAHPIQFCGSVSDVVIKGVKNIQVMVGSSNSLENNCPGPATTGTISVTFH